MKSSMILFKRNQKRSFSTFIQFSFDVTVQLKRKLETQLLGTKRMHFWLEMCKRWAISARLKSTLVVHYSKSHQLAQVF